MSIDYSQFYAGTSSIPSYGNSIYQKDTLVKYEFNTTDAHGNKVMDKMSKEETLQAMKDIRSQYGDNVIVEFSGDGMAALMSNRKGQIDEAMTDEQRAAKAERDVAFTKEIKQNELKEAAPEHIAGRPDYTKLMHEKSPETAEKMDSYLREFNRTQDKTYLQKAAKLGLDWFKESYREHKEWFSATQNPKTTASAASANNQPKLSRKAQKLLDELSAKYGFTSMGGTVKGGIVSKYGLALNQDGTATLFAELLNRAKEKTALLQASSENELMNMIEQFTR